MDMQGSPLFPFLEDLPHDISRLPCLRGLVVGLRVSYNRSSVTEDVIGHIFKACSQLEFVDFETNRTSGDTRVFNRWVRESNSENVGGRLDGEVAYKKFRDCAQARSLTTDLKFGRV